METSFDEPIPPQFDVFAVPEIGSHLIETSFLEEHHPINFVSGEGRNGDTIDFFIRGTEHWIDLNKSYFLISGEITGNNGIDKRSDNEKTPTHTSYMPNPKYDEPGSDVGFQLERNFPHTIFSSISISVCDKPVSPDSQYYPFVSFLVNQFNFSHDYLKILGPVVGWTLFDSDSPKGSLTGDNKIFLIMRPNVALFEMVRNLIPFVDFKISLTRVSQPSFYLNAGQTTDVTYALSLTSIVFKARKLKVVDSYNQAVESELSAGKWLRYKLKETKVFTKTYASTGSQLIEDNLFHGVLPKHIIIGFVKNEDFVGKWDVSCFKFDHFNKITEVSLFVNGLSFPTPPIRLNHDTKDTSEAFFLLMEAVYGVNSADPPVITKAKFDSGDLTFFAWNMAPDQYFSQDLRELASSSANVKVQVKFSGGGVTHGLVMVVYYETWADLKINKLRQVIYEPSSSI